MRVKTKKRNLNALQLLGRAPSEDCAGSSRFDRVPVWVCALVGRKLQEVSFLCLSKAE